MSASQGKERQRSKHIEVAWLHDHHNGQHAHETHDQEDIEPSLVGWKLKDLRIDLAFSLANHQNECKDQRDDQLLQ